MTWNRLALGLSIGLLLVTAMPASIWAVTEFRLLRTHSPPDADDVVPGPMNDLERGRRLATGVGLCTFCHGHDLGGKIVVDDPLLGRLYAPNLTTGFGGASSNRTDEELNAAIRWGVGPRKRSLLLMPSEHLQALTPEDMAAVIDFLRSVTPVDGAVPSRRVGPLTRLAMVLALSPELLSAERSLAPRSDVSSASSPGSYLVSIGSCRVCHGDLLLGGLHPLALPDEPEPPDISQNGSLATWSTEEFKNAMRIGITPDGRTLDPRYMPWPQFAGLSDDELEALFAYLVGET